MKILHLTLNEEWFDMILSGEKKEEYREIKPYWNVRLDEQEYDFIEFRNGYSRNARTMLVECLGIRKTIGVPKWGAPVDKKVYAIRLGEIIETKNLNQ